MAWINIKDRLPSKDGEYRVKNNSNCNNGEGVVYFSVKEGWMIPEMVKSFYKILHWLE